MSLFQFPKTKHTRRFRPKQYKRYQTYKRWLQAEFRRVCVYCRHPDSSAVNLVFGVDHYRPKGIPRFSHLICDYTNLLYCCNTCNSFKNDYWPVNERTDPYIVNPCDYEMADHLRFDAKTGKHESRSGNGGHTKTLLHLNDDDSVAYRKNSLIIVRALENEIAALKEERAEIEDSFLKDEMSQSEYDEQVAENEEALLANETARLAQIGETALALNQSPV